MVKGFKETKSRFSRKSKRYEGQRINLALISKTPRRNF
jgi:hypothetical protein